MKVIIDCPVCRKKSRVPGDKHLRYQCPQCNSIVEVNRGRILTFLQWTDPRSRGRSTTWSSASRSSKKALTWINSVLARPSRLLKPRYLLLGSLLLLVGAAGLFGIRKYQNFRTWRQAHATYLATAESVAVVPEAKAFVLGLLERGRQSGKHRVVVRFQSELKLKDWLDYPLAIRNGVDTFAMLDNQLTGKNHELPGEKPPPPIKGKIATGQPALEAIIVATLQQQFDSLFDPNPVLFTPESLAHPAETALAAVTVDYRIETLTLEIDSRHYPNLYKHIQTYSPGLGSSALSYSSAEERFLGYLLATRIKWRTQFRIPGEAAEFATASQSKPNSNLESTYRDPYRVLMESAFRNYAFSLSEEMGLPAPSDPVVDWEGLLNSNRRSAVLDSLLQRIARPERLR